MSAAEGTDDAVEILDDLEGQSAGASYGIITFAIRPHRRSRPHRHASEETWIVRSGSGYAELGGERVPLATGSRIVVRSELAHCVGNEQDEPLVVLAFWWRPSALAH